MPKKMKAKLTLDGQLLEAISKVDRPGMVCTGGDLPLVMPGLEVDGLGTVRLPLGKTQARKLAKLCRQAPYGQGTKTVSGVRKGRPNSISLYETSLISIC